MRYQKGIWIPKKDTWEVWSKSYEIRAYNKLQLKGDLCLDIGSHVGIWSKRLSKDFNKVICFEPLQKHIDCHMRNCGNLNNIELYEYALSNEEIQTEMITIDYNSGMSSFVEKKFKPQYRLRGYFQSPKIFSLCILKILSLYIFKM